jgi:hypothetical protein
MACSDSCLLRLLPRSALLSTATIFLGGFLRILGTIIFDIFQQTCFSRLVGLDPWSPIQLQDGALLLDATRLHLFRTSWQSTEKTGSLWGGLPKHADNPSPSPSHHSSIVHVVCVSAPFTCKMMQRLSASNDAYSLDGRMRQASGGLSRSSSDHVCHETKAWACVFDLCSSSLLGRPSLSLDGGANERHSRLPKKDLRLFRGTDFWHLFPAAVSIPRPLPSC